MDPVLMKHFRFILLTLFSVIALAVNAQKLPKIQEESVYAPVNIKIDGKATEWDGKFQAYNHATNLFYTIANDDNNLYLVVHATEPNIIYKIINGGITFTINPSGKKNDIGIMIIYPLFGRTNSPILNLKDKPVLTKDSAINNAKIDSFRNVINMQLTNKSKEIKVSGIKAINDTLISVYNEYGIKTAQLFDNKIAYTYELAIPLKYIGLKAQKFIYNIKINGMNTVIPKNATITVMIVKAGSMGAMADTDFWGEYSLAQK
ncbi:MAG TPA: hypothetical protein VIQ77_04155 [Mucilaginibacter sp.]